MKPTARSGDVQYIEECVEEVIQGILASVRKPIREWVKADREKYDKYMLARWQYSDQYPERVRDAVRHELDTNEMFKMRFRPDRVVEIQERVIGALFNVLYDKYGDTPPLPPEE